MSVAGEARKLAFGGQARHSEGFRPLGRVLLVGAICMLPVLIYAPFLNEPFMRDEGFFAAAAQKILDGGIPYRDAFDNKPPLIFGWYSLSFLIFGETLWAPRLLVSLMLSVAALLVYFQGRLLFSHRAGAAAALVFGLSIGLTVFETNANTEYFMLLPLVGAMLSFTLAERSDDSRLYALTGALTGLSIMTKETSLFVFLLWIALLGYRVVRDGGWTALGESRFLRPAAWLTTGCVAMGVLIILPFILTGTFDDMYEALVVYTLSYVGRVPLLHRIVAIAKIPLWFFFLTGPLFVVGALGMRRILREREGAALVVPGLAVATLLGIVAAGRFYDHYFVLILPAFALAVPSGAIAIGRLGLTSQRALLALLAVSLVPVIVLSGNAYLQPTPEERHLAKYPQDLLRAGWEVESVELGQWLKERTSPGDYIYNVGFQSEVYFYADRQSPTRFLFDHPFVADKYVDLAIEELAANPPKYVVDSAVYEFDTVLNQYPDELMTWVKANYDYVGLVYYADVYVLKDEVGG